MKRYVTTILGIVVLTVSVLVSLTVLEARQKDLVMNKNTANFTEEDWKKRLTAEEYRILRQKGTERAFSGEYYNHKESGVYKCAGCGEVLFDSSSKFDSGCGWPSYYQPADEKALKSQLDLSAGMRRIEVMCSNCGGHLGHVFNDGPKPTGLRYCINSVSLDFQKAKTITLGTGCFWCSEAAFETIDGVIKVEVGYMGGTKEDANYKKVCTGTTGHAEVSKVTYDPAKVSIDDILDVFWKIHDPTSLNRQGNDVGPQYRSVIFYEDETQKAAADKAIEKLQNKLADPIVTEVTKAETFYKAEDYHQDYYANNSQQPYCRAVIAPKLKKLKK